LWRTQDILRRILPEPARTAARRGGGNGVHAQWLAAEGWSVELIHPVHEWCTDSYKQRPTAACADNVLMKGVLIQ
jgi:hypothetical protein